MEVDENYMTMKDSPMNDYVTENVALNLDDTAMDFIRNGFKDDEFHRHDSTESISSSKSLDLPCEVPDGPQFKDLASYIDLVVDKVDSTPNSNNLSALFSKNALVFNDTICVSDNLHEPPSCGSKVCICPTSTTNGEVSDLFDDAANKKDFFGANFACFDNLNVGQSEPEQWATSSSIINKATADELPFNTIDFDKVDDDSVNMEESDEDFGDFNQFEPNTTRSDYKSELDVSKMIDSNSQLVSPCILDHILSHLDPTLKSAFAVEVINESQHVPCESGTITCHLNGSDSNDDELVSEINSSSTVSSTSSKIWRKLCSHDRIPEIKQYWWQSPIFMNYLNALNLKNHSVPVFANQLCLLEPERLITHLPPIGGDQNSKLVCETNSQSSNSLLHPTCPDNKSNQWTMNTQTTAQPSPLLPCSLDLDFFEMRSQTQQSQCRQSNKSKLSDLEAELLHAPSDAIFAISAVPLPTTAPLKMSIPSKTSPDSNSTDKQKKFGLSDVVRATLQRLPKFNYMRSSTLMFPVRKDMS